MTLVRSLMLLSLAVGQMGQVGWSRMTGRWLAVSWGTEMTEGCTACVCGGVRNRDHHQGKEDVTCNRTMGRYVGDLF